MNNKLAAIVIVLLLLIAGILIWVWRHGTPNGETTAVTAPVATEQPCPGDTEEIEMPDDQMGSLAKRGQKLRLTKNWYACNPINRDDIVFYRFSSTMDPIVRVVRAIPGDKFQVVRDEKVGAWNLKVNGKLVPSDEGNAPYYFGAKPPATLSLYEKANKGELSNGDVIIFAAHSPGANDSGIFGVANVKDIVGRIEPVQQ